MTELRYKDDDAIEYGRYAYRILRARTVSAALESATLDGFPRYLLEAVAVGWCRERNDTVYGWES